MGCKPHRMKRHAEDLAPNESTHRYEGCPGCQKATDHIVRDVVGLANRGEESDTHTHCSLRGREAFTWCSKWVTSMIFVKGGRRHGDGPQSSHPWVSSQQNLGHNTSFIMVVSPAAEQPYWSLKFPPACLLVGRQKIDGM